MPGGGRLQTPVDACGRLWVTCGGRWGAGRDARGRPKTVGGWTCTSVRSTHGGQMACCKLAEWARVMRSAHGHWASGRALQATVMPFQHVPCEGCSGVSARGGRGGRRDEGRGTRASGRGGNRNNLCSCPEHTGCC